ncbi:actin-like ATPase domain-containing protein [Nemania abortiva]|nr:actin-like ATPase domain-containing protein [Nemania abortiva]
MSSGSSRVAPRPTGGDRKILVAVDFGTTYSAVAWMQTRTNAQPGSQRTTVVDEWPDKHDTQDKVPTTLQYNGKGGEALEGSPSNWGFQTEEDYQEPKYQWFKLELDPKLRNMLAEKYPKTAIHPKPEHVEKLVTDYLRVLREHAESKIKASFAGLEDRLLRRVPWEYIITVPAVWPEIAQNTTRRCAANAGMASSSPVQIITEPEAAGIYALNHMAQEINLTVGDTFVICDAGGGTVDLISYTITSLKPVTRLEESAAGNGGLCGSTFLDRYFDDWLRRRFSGFFKWEEDGYHADALARWESEIKRSFNGDTSKRFFIPARGLPDTPDLGIRGGKVEVPGKKVKELFDPVISDILRLVNSQIDETIKNEKTVKAVLLAGGFGRNEYLKRRIQEEVGEAVKVEKMKDCNTAIVRGALIRGLASKLAGPRRPTIWVESRITRKHYGTAVWTIYDPAKHDPTRPKIAAGVEGSERIEIMQWFLKKGAKIKESEPASFKYYYDMSERDANQQDGKLDLVTLTVFTCDEEAQPKYPDTRKCSQLVKLTADLNKIPREAMRKEKGADNQWYYKIPFQIEMTCHSADISFDLIHEGTKYGSVKAVYM